MINFTPDVTRPRIEISATFIRKIIPSVNDDHEIMIITTEGIIIRMKVADISILGRVTSGVKLINMDDDVTIASIAKVREDKSLMDEIEKAEDSEEITESEESDAAEIE